MEKQEKPSNKNVSINKDIQSYNNTQSKTDKAICDLLAQEINSNLPEAENKIWHRHPVWFLDGNPITGYSKLKDGIRLMFWSGASFDEENLNPEQENSKMLLLRTHPLKRSTPKT